MATTRELMLSDWVKQQLNDSQLSIHPLPGDASFRRYARILSHQNGQNKSYMLMDAPTDKEDSQPFVDIAQWFDAHQVRVPQIVAQDLKQGFILLEDFGDTLLSQVLNDDTADMYYKQAMDQLLHLQQLPTQADLTQTDPTQANQTKNYQTKNHQIPAYDAQKLIAEMTLFDEWFVTKYLDIQLTEQEKQLLKNAYQLLADTALSQPQVVVHRDYHCRNLMVLDSDNSNDDKRLGVIDFQDAVVGAYSYDLISILRDAYVQWPDNKVQEWMQYFWQHLPANQTSSKTFNDFRREFDFMAAQRHLKVLGIFIRLNMRDCKTGYMKDLPLVLHYLLHEVQSYPELQDFNQFLQQRVLPAFLKKQPESQSLLSNLPAQNQQSQLP